MNKSLLVTMFLKEYPYISRSNAESVIDIILGAIVDSLREGKRVEIRGFGVFEVRDHIEKRYVNPRSGKEQILPKRKMIVFKPSEYLRTQVNNGQECGETLCALI